MKFKIKRILAVMLVFCMMMGMVPNMIMTAHAESSEEPTYTIIVNGGTADKTEAKAGETVTITENIGSNSKFTGWVSNASVSFDDPTAETTTFVMPAKNVIIKANSVPIFYVNVTGGVADKASAEYGETVTITANAPAEGMKFVGWTTESGVVFADASAKTTTFTMPGKAVKVTANYEGVSVNPSYTIRVDGGTADKTEAKAGEVVTITAATYSNSRFTEWVSDGVTITDATSATTTFVMPANDVTIKGNFASLYNVHVIGGSADKSQAVYGETVTITADIPEGMEFVEWTTESGVVFADSKATTTTFTMPGYSVLDITAIYKEIPVIPSYDIEVAGGTSDKTEAKEGETVTITAYPPASGMQFAKWTTEDGVEFADASAAETTFTMPNGNVRVDAVFEEIESYHVTVVGGTADREAAGENEYKAEPGETVKITAYAPGSNQKFAGWKVTVNDMFVAVELADASAAETTFVMPEGNVRVDATYTKKNSSGGSYGGGSYVAPDKDADSKLRIVMQINNKNILVNGKTMVNDVAPVIVADRTLVPIRVVTELLGGSAHWDNATRTVTLKIDGKTMNMTIGKEIPGFGTSAVIMNDRTYVPVRYVMEKLGADVEWINATRQIIIEK